MLLSNFIIGINTPPTEKLGEKDAKEVARESGQDSCFFNSTSDRTIETSLSKRLHGKNLL
jgi:hypothetical protein